MSIRSYLVATVIVLTCFGTVAGAAPDLANGKALAQKQCMACHSLEGKGNVKGPLEGLGAKLSADEIRQWMVDPKGMTAKANATRTPKMDALPNMLKFPTPEALDDVIAFVASLKTPPPPAPAK
jgi:mono/diheme cytochrome c family protein